MEAIKIFVWVSDGEDDGGVDDGDGKLELTQELSETLAKTIDNINVHHVNYQPQILVQLLLEHFHHFPDPGVELDTVKNISREVILGLLEEFVENH